MVSSPPFTFRHAVRSPASPAAVWRLWSDVGRWPAFDRGAERIELDGPFAAGTRGTMHLHGLPPLPFTLAAVEPERRFTDETPVGDALVRFHHRLAALPGGGSEIVYEVEIDGPEAGALGASITADVPETMARLAHLAEQDPTP